MDFKLIWSESSIEDLGAIVRFIRLRDGADIARQIGFGIYDRAQVLIRHPEAGSVLEEKQDANWRKSRSGRHELLSVWLLARAAHAERWL